MILVVVAAAIWATAQNQAGARQTTPTNEVSAEVSKAADDLVAMAGCGPRLLRDRNLSSLGPTLYSIDVGADGAVKGAKVLESSGDQVLDLAGNVYPKWMAL